ncbi:MAG: helix-turn-helix transcriptional regulator [Muribaculaceae bacterium]|nr:helix-turn-helix transcriptional regulator [Muribaculaceae bacterium]
MSRKDFLSSPEYWIAKAQIDLYNCAENFMESNNLNRTQLAKHLGVSKGYISQLLNGDYDHKLSKLVELAIAFGYVPKIDFQPIDNVLSEDYNEYKILEWKSDIEYTPAYTKAPKHFSFREKYESIPTELKSNVA